MLLVGVVLAAVLVVRFALLPRPAYSDTRGARVVRYTLRSKTLGRSLSEVAVLPPGGRRRPLLIFLHGRHDSKPWSWLIPSRSGPESVLSDEFFAALSRLGSQAPIVVVLNGGGHTYYHDRRAGRFGTAILVDAIPDAIARFRTTDRVAIGGISMGGYGALHLASLQPGRFCAVGGHSAALWQDAGDSAPGAFDDEADFKRHDVFERRALGRLARLPIWIDVGTKDPFRAADTAFAGFLRRGRANVRFHVWPGAHTRSYWSAHVDAYLQFYAEQLANCVR